MSVLLALVFVSLVAYAHNRSLRIRTLVEGLTSDEPEVAQSAVAELQSMGSDILPVLIPALREISSQARSRAADALRRVEGAVPTLAAALSDEDSSMRAAAAEVLGRMGAEAKDAVPALVAAIADESDNASRAATAALGEIGDPRAIDPLIATFVRRPLSHGPDDNPAEDALAKIGLPAVLALAATLKSEVTAVRESSARVLGKIGPTAREATPALIAALGDAEEGVRRAAKTALGEIKDARAVNPLIATFFRDELSDDSAQVALGKIGSEAIPPLIAKLTDERHKIRELSVSSLAHIGSAARDATPQIIALLHDRAEGVRRQAIWALGRIKDERGVVPLIALLKKKTAADEVIRALGEIGPAAKEATPLLWPKIWEDYFHRDAVAALKKISPESEDKIIYEERAYASLEDAVSVDLQTPAVSGTFAGDDGYPVRIMLTFKWSLVKRRPDVTFCSTVMLDKGKDPFDGGPAKDLYAGGGEQLTANLKYGEFYSFPFEWGVKVIACRDAGVRCDKRKLCVGRSFISEIRSYTAYD
jgi:HEAT repeat protein